MSTFVLVPGGWLGGWAWQRVARLLRVQDHDVYPVTLTGLGDRAHLASLGLEQHVTDVVATLEAEDVASVVLVGHSYGGVVISAVAEQIPERLAHLVYVDAVIPMNGQSGNEALRDIGLDALVDAMEADIARRGDGLLSPDPYAWGLDPRDVEWVRSRAVPHPVTGLRDAFHLGNAAAVALPRTYVLQMEALRPFAERAREAGATIHELISTSRGPVGHYSMFTAPEELTAILSSAAGPGRE